MDHSNGPSGYDPENDEVAPGAWKKDQARWRLYFEQADDLIFVLDTAGRIIAVNRAAAKVSGYTADELLGKSPAEFVVPDARASTERVLRKILHGEENDRHEWQLLAKDGRHIWLDIRGRPIYEGDQLVEISCIARDITERKRREAVLRESEQLFRSLVDNSHVGIIIIDDAFRLTYANNRLCRILGYSHNEIIGRDFPEFLDEESKQLIADRYVRRQRGEDVPSRYEFSIVGKNGETRRVAVLSTVMAHSAGKVQTVAQVLDVTERMRAEEQRGRLLAQIQEQAQRVEQIVDTVPDGVVVLDPDLRILSANPPARQYLAVLSDAKVGETLTSLGEHPLEELLTSPPKGLWHEVEAEPSTGRVFNAIARPLENGPEPEGWVLVLREVTQEREVQRHVLQQERLAAVGQLAAGIAHDFNNIMSVIVLYSQVSRKAPNLPPKIVERLQKMEVQARRATDLIGQILDFSRRSDRRLQPLDLLPLLQEQVELLKRTLPASIEIGLSHQSSEYLVNADPTGVQQVIMNLALNARDAMLPMDGGQLRIELEQLRIECKKKAPLPNMETGEWVQLRVSDSGTGIPHDVLPRIFEPFFTTKSPDKGTGLGLAQVYGIVKQHAGHIKVKSRLDEGTDFTIYLPALSLSQPQNRVEESEDMIQGGGETVLLVEDNQDTREALVAGLKQLNYRVLVAKNGREALSLFAQHESEIALVLSDLVMPVMGGKALAYALRERGIDAPVVILSGNLLEDEEDELRAAGVCDWLNKPPTLQQLAGVLATAAGRQGCQSEREGS
jgi:PAS domain S-box-containing protein